MAEDKKKQGQVKGEVKETKTVEQPKEEKQESVAMTKNEFAELVASIVEKKLEEFKMTPEEVKQGVLPNEKGEKEKVDDFEKMSKTEKFQLFFKSLLTKDIELVKALGGGTGSAGGYLIPREFKKDIIMGLADASVMYPLVSVKPVSRRAGDYPTLTGRGSYAWSSSYDNADFHESDPVFGQISYSLKRLDIFTAISQELLDDEAIDLERLIKDLFIEDYATALDEAIINGDGSTIPITGLFQDAGVPATALTAALDYDTLVDLHLGLKPQYRKFAVWVTSTEGLGVLKKIKDGNGNPILVDPKGNGEMTIFGRRVLESPFAPVDTTNKKTQLLFGMSKYFYLWDREEFEIKTSTEAGDAFVKNQMLIKCSNRVDGKIVLTEAFVKATGVEY